MEKVITVCRRAMPVQVIEKKTREEKVRILLLDRFQDKGQ
jgi:hypothetical protein